MFRDPFRVLTVMFLVSAIIQITLTIALDEPLLLIPLPMQLLAAGLNEYAAYRRRQD